MKPQAEEGFKKGMPWNRYPKPPWLFGIPNSKGGGGDFLDCLSGTAPGIGKICCKNWEIGDTYGYSMFFDIFWDTKWSNMWTSPANSGIEPSNITILIGPNSWAFLQPCSIHTQRIPTNNRWIVTGLQTCVAGVCWDITRKSVAFSICR